MRKTSDVNGAKHAKPQSGLALNKQIKAKEVRYRIYVIRDCYNFVRQ